ncbi:zinc finger protein 64 [Aethina tumida]|uniref:zinc finger protein 64 n=1 Tax=Aethina tumida TaxID=116153 RepID=UPI00096B3950|nr:zinc finger protein 64 [Aethina tumida]
MSDINKPVDMFDEQYVICRVCLTVIDNYDYKLLDDTFEADKKVTIRDVMHICLPEMDSYVTAQPVVCDECLKLMTSFYEFKTKYLETETKIKNYIVKNNLLDYNRVNLNCVIRDVCANNKIISNSVVVNGRSDTNGIVTESITLQPVFDSNYSCIQQVRMIPLTGPEALLSCRNCPFVSTDTNTMSTHRCMKNEMFTCTMCAFTTPERELLRSHVQVAHGGHTEVKKYQCSNCDFFGFSSASLKRHKRTSHNGVQQLLKCPKCQFQTTSPRLMLRHNATHTPTILKCDLCSYETKDRSNFKKHTFIHNRDSKPVKCNFCSYQCISPYQIKRHLKRAHAILNAPVEKMCSKVEGEEQRWIGHSSQ